MQFNDIDGKPAAAGKKAGSPFGLLAGVAAALLVAGVATAADRAASDAQSRYRQDRAACMSPQSQQDRATCLREAAAALQAAKRGDLGAGRDDYERNRMMRCDRLTGDERDDCMRRMHGEGTVSGSAESGGTYRELRTIVPSK